MNTIKRIIIDNNEYLKINYTNSKDIQNFYNFINKNKWKIQLIEIQNINRYTQKETTKIMYINNMKLHRISGPAIITQSNYMIGELHHYSINGNMLSLEEFEKRKNYYREQKLKRLWK